MKDLNRGKNIALAGTVLQVAFVLTLLIISLKTGSNAAMTAMWYFIAGVGIWLMTALLFYSRKLEQQERQELDDLNAKGDSGALFQRGQDLSLRPAAARVRFIEKWIVPGFTLILGAFYAIMGVLVFMGVRFQASQPDTPPLTHLGAGILFAIIPGFLAFLLSRYCTGMSSQAQWRALRAPAAQLLLGAVFIGGILGVFAAAWWDYSRVDFYVAYVIPAAQIVLAVELAITFLSEIFRPRVPGEQHRLTYDSRILGLLAEPARVGHSIAETLNYQFGFEVSKTWFYKLLGKALVPLVLLGVAVLWLMSGLVIVQQGHRGVVLHWGRAEAGTVLEPGLRVKWPWPIDTVQMFDTGKVHEFQVGVGEAREPIMAKDQELQLWTQKHGAYDELDFLVAIPSREDGRHSARATISPGLAGSGDNTPPPPVNIINLVLSVQYRIADPYKFGYHYVDAAKVFENASYREMVRYCASATLDTRLPNAPANSPQAIMTSGWAEASKALEERIRKAVGPEGLDLGVNVAVVQLIAVHPPVEAAEAFEAVLAAEREQDRARYEAEGEANKTLAAVAGDPDAALELAMAIRRLEQLDSLANLRKSPGEFDKYLRGYIRHGVESLKMLHKDILREGLLGKISASAGTEAQQVGYAKHLRDRMGSLDDELKSLIGQIVDWPMLKDLGLGGTAKQQLATQQVRNLLELLDVFQSGAKADLAERTAQARRQADTLFARAAGEPAEKVANAGGYRLRTEMAERTRAERFQRELVAWKASPNMYVLDRRLDTWDEVLPGMVKYVIGVDPRKLEIWLNWERQGKGLQDAFEGTGE